MTGVMVQSAGAIEGFLLDLRRALSECLSDNHFGTLHRLAHENGLIRLELEVTNTWANRIAGDEGKPREQRVTWAGSTGRGRGGGPGAPAAGSTPQLLPAGLIGPVRLISEVNVAAI